MRTNLFSPGRATRLVMLFALLMVLPSPAARAQTTVYDNNFEGGAGAEWSSNGTSTTSVASTPAAGRYLGRFSNQSTTLSLGSLAPHSRARVEFDLYIIGSWDGNGNGVAGSGPDEWFTRVSGGPTLLHTTFSNTGSEVGLGNSQAYPGSYPGGNFAARSGSEAFVGSPGNYGDTRYRLSYDFDHSGNTLGLVFGSTNINPGGDGPSDPEYFGLDNLKVSLLDADPGPAVPEPSALSLLLPGLAVAIWTSRRPGKRRPREQAEEEPAEA